MKQATTKAGLTYAPLHLKVTNQHKHLKDYWDDMSKRAPGKWTSALVIM